MAVNPPDTILKIATQAFTGLAVLFPTVLFGLYLERPRALPALVSIVVGEALVALYALKLLSTPGVLPAVPVMAGAFAAYALAHLLTAPALPRLRPAPWWGWTAVFGLLFLASLDFWRWGEIGPIYLGVPVWAWYFVGLSFLQTVAMAVWLNSRGKAGPEK